MNKLHILTKKSTIKQDLLFKEGDIYKKNLIDESLRKLRNKNYLYDIKLTEKSISDTEKIIKIDTYDQWTTTVGASFRTDKKGKNQLKIVLNEHNFLGLGKELKFKKDLLNTNKIDNEFIYNDYNLFASKDYIFHYSYMSDEYEFNRSSVIGKIFKSDSDKISYLFNINRLYDIEHNDKIYNDNFFLSLSNGKLKNRIEKIFRINNYKNEYNNVKININHFLFGLVFSSNYYIKTKFVDKYGVIENIKLGYSFYFGIKDITKILNASYNGWGYESKIIFNNKFNNDYFFQKYSFNYVYLNQFSYNTNNFAVKHLHKYSDRLKLINSLHYKKIHTYKNYDNYSLGDATGLRGYSATTLEGNKYLLFNSELQYVFKKNIGNFFYPGISLFFDLGRTYKQDENIYLKNFYYDIGLTFRLILYRTASYRQIKFAIARPLKKEHSLRITLKTDIDF